MAASSTALLYIRRISTHHCIIGSALLHPATPRQALQASIHSCRYMRSMQPAKGCAALLSAPMLCCIAPVCAAGGAAVCGCQGPEDAHNGHTVAGLAAVHQVRLQHHLNCRGRGLGAGAGAEAGAAAHSTYQHSAVTFEDKVPCFAPSSRHWYQLSGQHMCMLVGYKEEARIGALWLIDRSTPTCTAQGPTVPSWQPDAHKYALLGG
jgi:hypothetical protein